MKNHIMLIAGLAALSSHAVRDLETGTFLTRDPIGYADGPNVYCYVHANPITHFDAQGLKTLYIAGGGESIEGSYDGQISQLDGYGQEVGADAAFSWGDVDAAAQYITDSAAENPRENFILIGHSYGGPAAFRIADRLQDQGVILDNLTIVTLDPVSHISNNLLGTKAPDNVSEWINIYQPATVGDVLSDVPVAGWIGGGIWALGSLIANSPDGVASGGGQWNRERNANRNIPAVHTKDAPHLKAKKGDTMNHMDVSPMLNLPLKEGNGSSVRKYIEALDQQGETKKKVQEWARAEQTTTA